MQDERSKKAFFIVEPKWTQLAEIAGLLETGKLKCCVDVIVPFAKASDAYCGKIEGRGGRGKMVLAIAE